MNRLQDAQDGMGKLVYEYLGDNTVTITASGVTKITDYTDDLGDTLAAIDSISPNTAKKTQGITQTKAQAKEVAIQAACRVAGMVQAYALDNGNTTLATGMTFTPAELRSKKDEDLRDYLRLILMDATDASAPVPPATTSPLIPYGIVPDGTGTPVVPGTLTVFEGLITIYSDLTTSPRSAITTRKGFNTQLRTAFADMETLLLKLDNLVEALRGRYPDFVTGYFDVRKVVVISLRARIAGIVSLVDDASLGTTKAAKGATITIIAVPVLKEVNGQMVNIVLPPVTLKTDANGQYAYQAPLRTMYTVKVSFPGYNPGEEAGIEIGRGDRENDVDFLLQHETPATPPVS